MAVSTQSKTEVLTSVHIGRRRLHVGMVYWSVSDGVLNLISQTFVELGCEVSRFLYDEPIPQNLDFVFAFGPGGSIVPLVKNLAGRPSNKQPLLVIHHAEQFPNPGYHRLIHHSLGRFRSILERLKHAEDRRSALLAPLLRLTNKGIRFRYYGDLLWINRLGVDYQITVESPLTAQFLRCRGFTTLVSGGFGFPFRQPWGADLALERDIPVLWIGKWGSGRRRRLLQQIRQELKTNGVDMYVVDGVENPYVFGEDRTTLLNRTKVTLNLLRQTWDYNGGRFYLAGLNRVLVISEPLMAHNPVLVPGVHYVERPVGEITEAILYYLKNDEERRQITIKTQQIVQTQLDPRVALEKIITAIKRD